ncbi:phosphotransferase enzyme family protein [Cellulomonas sp. NPDC055163]
MEAAAIARRFGLGRAVALSDGPVARGKQGAVWRLSTSDGVWAVKVPREAPTETEIELAARAQEAAHRAGVPTPEVRRTPQGEVLADVGGARVRVYGWVDLLPPDARLDPALVGSTLGLLHRVAAPHPGPVHPWYTEPVGAAGWDRLVAELRDAGAPFAERLAALRDELVALEAWIEPPGELRVCHCDLWADNVLPAAGEGLCVIDWENAGPADPRHELACVLFEFARDDPGRARALQDAYADAGGPARLTGTGDLTMLVAQLGHITQAAATDWLTPNARSPERADAAAWVGEVLDDPHTRVRLRELLDAVR